MYKRRPLLDAPYRLVENGSYQLGTFCKPIRHINLTEAKQPLGFSAPSFINNLRLREWQAFQIGNKDHFFMVAIYNTKLMGVAHFSYYDIKKGKKTRYEIQIPSVKTKVASGLYNTTSFYNSKKFKICVENRIIHGEIALTVVSRNFKKQPDIQAQFTGFHQPDESTPIVVCQPFDKRRVMYSHKALMPMQGTFTIGSDTFTFNREDSWMIMDDHKGYYPRHTLYDWVTGAVSRDGVRLGFNLTDNQVIKQEEYNENCLWFDDELHLLPPVTFERPNGLKGKWYVKDAYGRVDVTFTPSINTSICRNYLLIKSNYQSPYGYFEGYLAKESGEKVDLEGVFGAGEQFDILL